eukprot:1153403-Pelagomonas_calceolata.AAC.4
MVRCLHRSLCGYCEASSWAPHCLTGVVLLFTALSPLILRSTWCEGEFKCRDNKGIQGIIHEKSQESSTSPPEYILKFNFHLQHTRHALICHYVPQLMMGAILLPSETLRQVLKADLHLADR